MSDPPLPDAPERAPTWPGSDESADAYFERLDAAFASRDSITLATPEVPGASTTQDERLNLPTVAALLSAKVTEQTTPISNLPLRPPQVAAPGTRSVVADAFSALLAVEQGASRATPVRLTSGEGEPRLTDTFVDEVTRRVMERLASGTLRVFVGQVVTEVTERLIREEIERMRRGG